VTTPHDLEYEEALHAELADRDCQAIFIKAPQCVDEHGATTASPVAILDLKWADIMPQVGESVKLTHTTDCVVPDLPSVGYTTSDISNVIVNHILDGFICAAHGAHGS